MDAWADSSPVLGAALSDPLVAPLVELKRSLPLDQAAEAAFFAAVCDGDLVSVEQLLRADPALANASYPSDSEPAYSALVFAIAFDHVAVVESLLKNSADPDAPDLGPGYTPLMWAVHCRSLPMVKVLLEFQADPRLAPSEGKSAVSLVTLDHHDIYDYFKAHNLFLAAADEPDVFRPNSFGGADSGEMDNLQYQIRMLTLTNASSDSAEEEELDEEAELALDTDLVQTADFDYDKVLADQCIRFLDADIPSLLDYIFGLRTAHRAHQHNTKLPGAIMFQLIRYSHNKVGSKDLTEFLFECFITRLRSVTNTKSGVFNMAITTADDKASAGGAGDIVLLSYWLSVIQFLHFYLAKGKVYLAFPKFLQELINLTQSLVATLSFSINTRLNPLMDDCLLNYTSLVDVSGVLYAKDWNLFKLQKKHPNTYDDILDMLFPPNQMELMKPSPLRYVQVLGALDYVLKLHSVDPLVRFQTFSQVFYYINAVLFNKLISSSKYCSRAKAIQIRLNVSALEDWLRSHNLRIHKPDHIGGLQSLIQNPDSDQNITLSSLLEETDESKGPHSLSFYYKSLYHIGKAQLMPTIELLQWLQVMSGLKDEEGLINTINQFEALNYYQLLKVTNKLYRYEVDEKKVPKPLIQLLKGLVAEQGENQVARSNAHYMTQSTFLLKEVYIYLNPNYVFAVALPNLSELIVNYGAGLGGVRVLRSRKFQPTLPISVMDDVDEILTANKNANLNDTFDYEEDISDDEAEENAEGSPGTTTKEEKTFKGDEMFKHMEPPLSLAHKNWGNDDIESNPW